MDHTCPDHMFSPETLDSYKNISAKKKSTSSYTLKVLFRWLNILVCVSPK